LVWNISTAFSAPTLDLTCYAVRSGYTVEFNAEKAKMSYENLAE